MAPSLFQKSYVLTCIAISSSKALKITGESKLDSPFFQLNFLDSSDVLKPNLEKFLKFFLFSFGLRYIIYTEFLQFAPVEEQKGVYSHEKIQTFVGNLI